MVKDKNLIVKKVFIIYNRETYETYFYSSLENFVKDFPEVTLRLLRYTHPKQKERLKNGENVRYQPYHKNFQILQEVKNGFKYVTDLSKDEYCVYIQDLGDWFSEIKSENTSNAKQNEEKKDMKENNTQEKDSAEILIKEIKSLKKKLQRARDENTLLRRVERENVRAEKEYEDIKVLIYKTLQDINKKEDFKSREFIQKQSKDVGLLVLSDWHIGKTVNLENGNKFDYFTARKRVITLLEKSIEEIRLNNINELHIALLGDFIHARYREDMKYTSEFVEIDAGIRCFLLFRLLIDKLCKVFPNMRIYLHGVVGNESRLASNLPHTNIDQMAKNSIDYMVYTMLDINYKDSKQIKIGNFSSFETIITIKDKNILLIHGDKINHTKLDSEIPKLKLRLSEKFKVNIDYVLMGHIHSSLVTDLFARNASLVGADEYATIGLNIPQSVVSQLFGTINEDIKMYSLKIKDEEEDI